MIRKRDDSPKDELASRPDGPGSLFFCWRQGRSPGPGLPEHVFKKYFFTCLSYIIFLLRLKFGKIKVVCIIQALIFRPYAVTLFRMYIYMTKPKGIYMRYYDEKGYTDLNDKIETVLMRVNRPAEYMGGELHMRDRDPLRSELNFGFCFPDTYEIGMSYLGLQIIYHVLNEQPGVYCQRMFAPADDMEQIMRSEDIPLFTLEKKQPAAQMDVLGFTLQYELSFTNILNMLDLAGIPLLSEERGEDWPVIAAGGNCSFNPEPLADIIDFFMLGDGEDVLAEVSAVIKAAKAEKLPKSLLLERLAGIGGVYVPSLYRPEYDSEGRMTGHSRLSQAAPDKVVKRIVMDLDNVSYPLKPLVPFTEVVHDRSVIELFRGCTRGCRFCQAGIICRPVRERSRKVVVDHARRQLENTGYDEVSLLSLSTSDYSEIEPLVTDLMATCASREAGLSLPSLRLDSFSSRILQEIQEYRKTGLTFAPEAGTQRLRNIINKSITDDHINAAAERVIELGYNNIKLYFMIGLPGETDEDLDGIVDIARRIVYMARQSGANMGRFNVTASVSNFVPKAQTPFQWVAQDTPEEFDRKHKYLMEHFRKVKCANLQYHGTETSFLEAVFARGDRRVGRALVRAFELGCRFDGWSEHFDYSKWLQAFRETDIVPEFYTQRVRETDEYLPWDIIDCGVTKKYLRMEHDKAFEEAVTLDCRQGCTGCGIKRFVECPVYEQSQNYKTGAAMREKA